MNISDMKMYGCELIYEKRRKDAPCMDISDMDIPHGAIPQSRNQFKSLIEKKSLEFPYEERKSKQLKDIKEETED